MKQLNIIIVKVTKNFSQKCNWTMNNTRKIPYFLACQNVCRTYINKLKRKSTQN